MIRSELASVGSERPDKDGDELLLQARGSFPILWLALFDTDSIRPASEQDARSVLRTSTQLACARLEQRRPHLLEVLGEGRADLITAFAATIAGLSSSELEASSEAAGMCRSDSQWRALLSRQLAAFESEPKVAASGIARWFGSKRMRLNDGWRSILLNDPDLFEKLGTGEDLDSDLAGSSPSLDLPWESEHESRRGQATEDGLAQLRRGNDAGLQRSLAQFAAAEGETVLAQVAMAQNVSEKALKVAMMQSRVDGDPGAAAATLRMASEVTERLPLIVSEWARRAAADPPAFEKMGPMALTDALRPFAVHVLAGEWERAQALAQTVLTSAIVIHAWKPTDHLAKILMLLLQDDAMAFDTALDVAQVDWNRKKIYQDLGKLAAPVAHRDSQAFSRLLASADKKYANRGRLSAASEYRADFGTSGYNEAYFDYLSLVIAKIARRVGMAVSVDSAFLPSSVLELSGR